MHIPRIIISGLSGGAGKTMLSLGLARAFVRLGKTVRAFKKGPDYIDAAWLALASRAPQGNLDPYFSSPDELRGLFISACSGSRSDIALIEGNRGLFDGLDISGSCSTAELSRILNTPVLLVLDCTKMTRTAAAVVKGCIDFEDSVRIGGVILNRTGSPRHRDLVRRAIEELAGVPVLGVLPRKDSPLIVERHMGLAGTDEHVHADRHLDALADFVAEHVDLDAVASLAASAPALDVPGESDRIPATENTALLLERNNRPETASSLRKRTGGSPPRPVIGYARDAAFWFYYRENLDALAAAGAALLPLSLLDTTPWPRIDGLYLGGGLPELHAEALSKNRCIREHVAFLAQRGLPIYAECGGFMFLAKSLMLQEIAYPMAGVFSCDVEFCPRPQGLGYVHAEVLEDTPYHPKGSHFRGHEFHFSRCLPVSTNAPDTPHVLRLHKGRGMAQDEAGRGLDGLLFHNTFASYTHIYAPALPHWAPAFVALC